MQIKRRFTTAGKSPYEKIPFRRATSEIKNPDGSIVFKLENFAVPEHWSQVAADILAQKYFRKAGVPARLKRLEETQVPSWLWRSGADERALAERPEHERYVGEADARQVFDRLAGTWTYWGWKGGYFSSEDDARAFFDEHRYMLAMQYGAPNSPQWFNTGLHWAYGIDGPGQGHSYVDHVTGELTQSQSAYEHPQPHACFIQSIEDDLVNENGIMDLWVREARLFKYGSGTGSNFSKLRSENEKLSGGGKSSGLMSFLRIGDRAAGAIKSGGTTRRAAKMVVVDVDHPDIEAYIDWKVKEEQKVAALVTGSKICQRRLKAIMKACVNCEAEGEACFDPAKNPALKRAVKEARRDLVPDNYIRRIIQFARQGYKDIEFATYDTDWDSEAYLTVSGQNSNNSVRVTDEFLAAVEEDKDWALTARLSGKHRQDAEGPRPLGEDRPCRLGERRPRHPVPHHHQRLAHLPEVGADPRLQSLLGVHVPRRHGVQPGVPQPDDVPGRGQALRRRRLRARLPAVDHRARDLRADGAVPIPEDRRAQLSLPHAGARLRQHRRPADGLGHPLRQPRGPRHLRRAVGHHDRRRLCHVGRDGPGARALPRLRAQPVRHAARHPQPPPRRLRPQGRLREARHHRPCRSTPPRAPTTA